MASASVIGAGASALPGDRDTASIAHPDPKGDGRATDRCFPRPLPRRRRGRLAVPADEESWNDGGFGFQVPARGRGDHAAQPAAAGLIGGDVRRSGRRLRRLGRDRRALPVPGPAGPVTTEDTGTYETDGNTWTQESDNAGGFQGVGTFSLVGDILTVDVTTAGVQVLSVWDRS